MGEKIKIVIPSAWRAKNVTTTRFFKDTILCVPQNQLEEYQYENPTTEVVAHPDNVIGMGNKRNWIMKHFGSVFMIDDATLGLLRVYQLNATTCKPDEATDIIYGAATLARLMGCYLFGFNRTPRPLGYKGLKPIALTGFVNGAAMGILSGGCLKFNPDIHCNNDMYISCLNAFHYRKAYLDNRYCIKQNSVAKNTGGLSSIRNAQRELEDIETMKKLFGPVIKVEKRQRSAKEYNMLMQLPF